MARAHLLRPGSLVIASVLTTALSGAAPDTSFSKYVEVPKAEETKATPAYRYANMSDAEVLLELEKRRIAYQRVDEAPGVRLPIRLEGRLRGVWIHSVLPAKERKESKYEILDGRLALALDDFASLLALHDIVEVVHYTMYRPPGPAQAKSGDPQHRHPGGMAIDLGAVKRADGQWLSVAAHWPGEIDAKTCGEAAHYQKARRARELQSLACEAHDLRLFHYTLTPHYDDRHKDHLHLEIKAGVNWFLMH